MSLFRFKELMPKAEQERIVTAIRQAESTTSGEIRVHLERKCKEEPLKRAQAVFTKLEMQKTEARNGVLLYVAVNSQHCAVFGDKGIYEKVDSASWQVVIERLSMQLKTGQLSDGIIEALDEISTILSGPFPIGTDDKNELSDDISGL